MVFQIPFKSDTSRFGVAEQAINAIYLLASQPDILCGEIVKEKTRAVFQGKPQVSMTQDSVDADQPDAPSTSFKGLSSVRSLSQLMFIVGHIASISPFIDFLTLS
jgi:condensin complex subunit 1